LRGQLTTCAKPRYKSRQTQFGPAPAGFIFTENTSYFRKFALVAELRLASCCSTFENLKMSIQNNTDHQAQVLLPSKDLTEDIAYFSNLGFKLDNIFPSDDPEVAMMSGHGIHIRLDKKANCPPATIYLLTDHPEQIGDGKGEFTAPNGTLFKVHLKSYHLSTPATQHKFEVRQLQDNDPWVIGRAGMLYRDLIPDRLGGGIIASHIRIPDGGPVPDMVHYHTIILLHRLGKAGV